MRAKQSGFEVGAQDTGSEFASGQKSGQYSRWPEKAKISSEDFTLKTLPLLFSPPAAF